MLFLGCYISVSKLRAGEHPRRFLGFLQLELGLELDYSVAKSYLTAPCHRATLVPERTTFHGPTLKRNFKRIRRCLMAPRGVHITFISVFYTLCFE
jgi:hypothetical protein